MPLAAMRRALQTILVQGPDKDGLLWVHFRPDGVKGSISTGSAMVQTAIKNWAKQLDVDGVTEELCKGTRGPIKHADLVSVTALRFEENNGWNTWKTLDSEIKTANIYQSRKFLERLGFVVEAAS